MLLGYLFMVNVIFDQKKISIRCMFRVLKRRKSFPMCKFDPFVLCMVMVLAI